MDLRGRNEPPLAGDERATLTGFLQFQRDTLAMKCADLTADQLKERGVPPSTLSLLGIVRHMAEVERSWFRTVLMGEQTESHWTKQPTDFEGESASWDTGGADSDEAFAVWREECARSRDTVAAAESLATTGSYDGEVFSLRWILTHMIEEYARHNGHADLLRERLDGDTGE